MELQSLIPDILPHLVPIGSVHFFQSLIAGLLGTGIFIFFVLVYAWFKQKDPYHRFVQGVDVIVE